MTSKQSATREEPKSEKGTGKTETLPLHPHSSQSSFPDKCKVAKTKVVIKYDCGFGNSLYVRGTGAALAWDHGILLKNTRPDEWVWETETPFSKCEFKVVLNDQQFEIGENHILISGSAVQYTPKFSE